MTKNFKIAFFGTSDRSLPILESLNDHFNLILCITKTDSIVGRKKETRETQVKVWARENGVETLLVSNLGKQQEEVIEKLTKLDLDLVVVADFSFMVPQAVIDAPRHKTVNIHFSLLPKLRGASPIQHAILGGLRKTGITYYLMDADMDTGDILEQVPYKLTGRETTGELYNDMFKLAAAKLPQVIKKYAQGKIRPIPQDDSKSTYCYSKTNPRSTTINKKDARIDWGESAEAIERQVRAYTPWPISWTTIEELENNPTLSEELTLKNSVDRNLTVKILASQIKSGKLEIKRLRVAGKKEVDWDSFVNGYSVKS